MEIRKYYYSDGANEFGPFTLDELRYKNLTRTTLVWYQGLSEWIPAGQAGELSELFTNLPPLPVQSHGSNTPKATGNQTLPKTWLTEAILVTIFCCIPFGVVGIVMASKVESQFNAGDIEGAQKSSADAKKWTTLSFWIGLGAAFIYVFLMMIGVIEELL